ncbi:MAG: HlyC/CorC family transporter [Gammaproteobacteria bacterium]|nr:HlyC/CorC family transporter [Gammaproteobacteria bacterium]
MTKTPKHESIRSIPSHNEGTMEITVNLFAIVILLAANGFFVAAEFALVKARGFRIEVLAAEGSASARLTMHIQANLEAYLAACQLGITMASLGLGWVGEPAVAALLEPLFHTLGMPDSILHTTAFLTGFLIFSSLHIVVGEQVPKTLAIRKAEPVSLWVAYPLHFSYMAVFPLNWLLNKASSMILRSLNVEEATHADVLSGDELKGLVATSKEHGEIEHDKAAMLHNLFEFDQRYVGRVMISRNDTDVLDIAATGDANLQRIKDEAHSRFPVIDGGNDDRIVGILLTKDIYTALISGEHEPWQDLQRYVREPLVVPETQKVSELFELMRTRRAHLAIVVDEYGTFAGIVSLEDLLEEIVGEIHDETDDEQAAYDIESIADNHWEVDGLVTLNDLEKAIDFEVADDLDANTLSGLFMNRLQRMPVIGDEIVQGAYKLKVLSHSDRRVGRVAIERIPGNAIAADDSDDNKD